MASFGGSARAGIDPNSISAARANSALMIVIPDVDRRATTKCGLAS
jgi:hypothetical protein